MWPKLLCVALILVVGTACTRGERTPKDTLVVALGSEPATLDPRFATDANGMRIAGLIFNGLVRVGTGFRAQPEAASAWELRDRVYTFKIKPDLRFHNGRPVSKEDLEFSFQCYRQPGSPFASALKSIEDVRVSAEGAELRVHVKVTVPGDKFLINDLPTIKILPRREIEQLGDDFNRTLTGSGPYAFVSSDLNSIRLRAVQAQAPFLLFKIVRDDFTRYQKLMKGEVDLVQTDLPADKIADFEARPDRFAVVKYPGLSMTYILLNHRDPVLKMHKVRKALALAINREDIIRYKLNGLGLEATSLLTPNNPYAHPTLKNPPFDSSAARALVTDAGALGHGLELKTSNAPQAVDNGRVLANQLSAAGLVVNVRSYEWGTFYDDVKQGRFQMATMRWVGTVDPDLYRSAFHSSELPPGRNRGAYANARLDKLLDQVASVGAFQPRKALYQEIQKIVFDDFAIIPLWYDQQVTVLRKGVRGYEPSHTGDFWPLTRVTKN